jgi:hypothetical protein
MIRHHGRSVLALAHLSIESLLIRWVQNFHIPPCDIPRCDMSHGRVWLAAHLARKEGPPCGCEGKCASALSLNGPRELALDKIA